MKFGDFEIDIFSVLIICVTIATIVESVAGKCP